MTRDPRRWRLAGPPAAAAPTRPGAPPASPSPEALAQQVIAKAAEAVEVRRRLLADPEAVPPLTARLAGVATPAPLAGPRPQPDPAPPPEATSTWPPTDASAARPRTSPGDATEGPASAGTAAPGSLLQRWAEHRRQARSQPRPGDEQFMPAVRAAQVLAPQRRVHAALYLMLATVALTLTWAASTQVEQITRADARVVPDGREQVIASLEGGILRELMVREGEQVRAGQPLLRLDPTRFESQQAEGQARRQALRASIARLQAEAEGRALRFPAELGDAPRITQAETDAYQARQRLLEQALGAAQRSVALLQRELSVAEDMAAKGLMSEVEVMRLRRQVIELRQQAAERQSRFRQDASTDLLRTQAELAQLDEQLVARDDAVRRTVIDSPVRGLVKNIRVNTLGGVVGPGAAILEIVPLGDRLRVEARVRPADIGFVRVGQAATVKLSAYEFNLYGGLQGRIESISPDALGDTERAGPDATWFRALVAIEHSSLQAGGQPLPVLPGMTGSVEINTGQRSVLDYLLRPLLKSREAFRER